MKTKASLLALLISSLFSTAFGQIVVPPSTQRTRSEAPGTMHTNIVFYRGSGQYRHLKASAFGKRVTIQGYTPADIQAAYQMPSNGGADAIAIVDGYDLPTSLSDFNTFSSEFGLPVETSTNAMASTNKVFQLIYSTGKQPAFNNNGYGDEIALDVQWAHAMAPNAKIYLIECPTESISDLMGGVGLAAGLSDVRDVSLSWGGDETQGQTQYDPQFTAANQSYFAAAGDQSNLTNWPATSPNVVGVGGTSLDFSAGHVVSEVAWSSGGGGLSSVYSRPTFQNAVVSVVGSSRGCPDIAAVADPNNGVAVFDSTSDGIGQPTGWEVVGGTSLSCPVCAGITNVRGAYSATSSAELTRIYGFYSSSEYHAYYRDIVSGTSGSISAAAGYDLVTGIGAPTGLIANTTYVVPAGVTVSVGTAVQGVPDSVLVKDGHDLIMRSVPVNGQQGAQLTGSFTSPQATGSQSFTASINVVGMIANATATISVYNLNTQNWDSLGSLGLSTSNSSVNVTIPNTANYFTSSGQVQFQINATGSNVFRLGIDQLQLAIQSL